MPTLADRRQLGHELYRDPIGVPVNFGCARMPVMRDLKPLVNRRRSGFEIEDVTELFGVFCGDAHGIISPEKRKHVADRLANGRPAVGPGAVTASGSWS